MKKVVLCPNIYRDPEFIETRKAVSVLQKIGLTCVISLPFFSAKTQLPQDLRCEPIKAATKDADLLISLGGDGSILHVAKTAALRHLPVLGINLGNLGYMAELESSEIELLRCLHDEPLQTETRMMMNVQVLREGKQIYSNLVLNDAVITKGAIARVVQLQLFLDHEPFLNVGGDGVIVSTPTGSTAYSLAAGGPIVEPTAQNIIITPICDHALASNSYVLAPEHTICVTGENNRSKTVYLSADGGKAFPLKEGDKVMLTRSHYAIKLLKLRNRSFYGTLCEKMAARREGK